MRNPRATPEKSRKRHLALRNRASGLAIALLLFVFVLYIATLAKLAI
ncbi:MAG: Hypothetical protein BHV28_14110 [Candidatus Tokpelaia hoelldobleri]|uniref:Uncharacterized protein n=1 Tax=Candidatus Tokpelaia hoelldobleri TaxID=1902579 RepID=A0A1U9JW39_9HYPH|nr:MAG: Hypothetical protein BHV28_14110 [Candidatus Tokpelaia hoelldoblerii]